MAKHVEIIASGETERRALPHLMAHLNDEGIVVDKDHVRYPPHGMALNVEMAEKLVKAAWFASVPRPDKVVILLDTDGKSPTDVLQLFQQSLPGRLAGIPVALQFAYAQWHLEAWFFADVANLRAYLGRDQGGIDPSNPDEIQNPKHHLKQLLGDRKYTAVVSEEIAARLDPATIAGRSPSFRVLLDAVRNGQGIVTPEHAGRDKK
jgi:Domain of unknown function (DUF4276)